MSATQAKEKRERNNNTSLDIDTHTHTGHNHVTDKYNKTSSHVKSNKSNEVRVDESNDSVKSTQTLTQQKTNSTTYKVHVTHIKHHMDPHKQTYCLSQ